MELAIREAQEARRKGDYAVGAVLVRGGKIISAESNRSKRDQNPIAHAEVLTILKASKIFKTRHLSNCILYVTHEPCSMCTSVAVWARLRGIIYGARISDMKKFREKNGNKNWLWRTIEISCEEIINKSTEKIPIVKDFMRKECIQLFHS